MAYQEPIDSTKRDVTLIRAAQVGLSLAGLGALILIVDPFGIAIAGLVLGVIGAALAFPYGAGERWYAGLAGGAVLGIIAKLIAGPHQTMGGWLAVLAVIAILIGASLGFPGEQE